jgi:hypothetical protein
MGIVFRTGRVKIGDKPQSVQILQFDSVASAVEHYGEEGTLALVNRGLKGALGRVIQSAAASGTDFAFAQQSYVPTIKARGTGAGVRVKGPARLAREALKSGVISKEELASFLASRGVTA